MSIFKPAFYLPVLFVLLILHEAAAQKEANIWYFGRAGLNFNSSPPTPLTDIVGLRYLRGKASIADSKGNLLFYTDGITVVNKNHQECPTGKGYLAMILLPSQLSLCPIRGMIAYFIFLLRTTLSPFLAEVIKA